MLFVIECSLKRVVTVEGYSPRHSERCPSTMGPAGTCSSGVSPWWWCLLLLPRVEHPAGCDRWAVGGVLRNYYAITHKPIDLDWTPGGVLRAIVGPLRFVTRPTLEDSRVLDEAARRQGDISRQR